MEKDIIPKSFDIEGNFIETNTRKNISDYVNQGETPGNVGICFSGGGSVAMISALGQMRALNNKGYLGKARAISTVSGGSWATVPFMFLPDNISDETFLGEYVSNNDMGQLKEGASNPAFNLNNSPEGYLGHAVTLPGISAASMGAEAGALYVNPLFPTHRIWNQLMGKHILKPFGLSEFSLTGAMKDSWFAYDDTHVNEVLSNPTNANSEFKNKKVYKYQNPKGVRNTPKAGRIQRPLHLCNTSMFIKSAVPSDKNSDKLLAPVQCNAFGTGIIGKGLGQPYLSKGNAADFTVGEGLVSSYAMGSTFESSTNLDAGFVSNVKKDMVHSAENQKLFSLADITANSSAFYASLLIEKKLVKNGSVEVPIALPSAMDPQYNYFAVPTNDVNDQVVAHFADGGAIENCGINNLLAHDDIDAVVSFVNALKSIEIDPNNHTPGIDPAFKIMVDTWIPPLFGFTPYQGANSSLGIGYHKYSDYINNPLMDTSQARYFKYNQIFDSNEFVNFLNTIYKNANPDGKEANSGAAVYINESMTVLRNDWFGITGGKTIKFMLFHYNPNAEWWNSLDSSLTKDGKKESDKGVLKRFVDGNVKKGDNLPNADLFPNFKLTQTHMEAPIANSFAQLTSYVTSTQYDALETFFK